jgi:succinoglycan biosynthesis transport protein ExoP
LHLGIERAGSRGPVQVLLVTSTWPGEGKTTLALSLGAMIARGGRRVVVVDLDLRHPNVARQLGCSVKAGLAEYVERGDALAEVVQIVPGAEARLHVIPTRAPVSNPADVLASTRLKALIADLRLRYDTVILDVPPSLAVTDALVVGALADAALFVVQWGATTDVAAFNGLTALEKAGVHIVGCALTLVDPKQQSLYGYHDAGGYSQKYRQYFIE